MKSYGTLMHMTWECKYYVIFIPKCRRNVMDEKIRKYLGELFKDLSKMSESEGEEGYLLPSHVHMLLSIPPKYSVSEVIGFMKGKSTMEMM